MILILMLLIISSCNQYNDADIIPEYRRAKTLFIKNRPKEALTVLERIEEKDPFFLPGLYLSGRIYFINSNYEKAETKFKKIIQKSPCHFQAGKQLLRLYVYQKEFSKAEDIFLKLVKYSWEDPELLMLAGKLWKCEEKYLEAIEYYSKAFLFEEKMIDAHIDIAEIYKKYGISDKARDHLKKAAAIGGEKHELYEPVMSIVENME